MYISHSSLRRKGSGPEASKGRKATHGKNEKNTCLVNKCLPGHPGAVGHRTLNKQALLVLKRKHFSLPFKIPLAVQGLHLHEME